MTFANGFVAAIIVVRVTGNVASWWVVLAPIAVLLITGFVIWIANYVFGWNWRWRAEWERQIIEADGNQLVLWLRPKNRGFEYPVPDVRCCVSAPPSRAIVTPSIVWWSWRSPERSSERSGMASLNPRVRMSS